MPVKNSQEIDDRLEQLLAKVGPRDRGLIEKRLAAMESDADSDRAILWCRLLLKLSDLVPLPAHPVGSDVMQFFIPDGKYRMQVFALDAANGSLILYLPDVLAKAVDKKLLVKSAIQYSLAEAPNQVLAIERMDVSSLNPPEFMKHMIGWNRKAVKLTLQNSSAESVHVKAAEQLCELAATEWDQSKVTR